MAWTKVEGERGFWLLSDECGAARLVGAGVMDQNGHQTYLPGTDNTWILNDTYPNGKKREMTLYLYHVPSDKRLVLGKFRLPKAYYGEWRSDLHPRSNADGTKIVIDSAHGGNGRQLYLIDLKEVADFSVRS